MEINSLILEMKKELLVLRVDYYPSCYDDEMFFTCNNMFIFKVQFLHASRKCIQSY